MTAQFGRRNLLTGSAAAGLAWIGILHADQPALAASSTASMSFGADVLVVESFGYPATHQGWRDAIAAAVANPGRYSRIVGTAPEYKFHIELNIDGLSDIVISGLGVHRTTFRAQINRPGGVSLQRLFANMGTAPVKNVTFEDFSVDCGMLTLPIAQQSALLRDERPYPAGNVDCLLSAIAIRGNRNAPTLAEARDITIRRLHIFGSRELPLSLSGIAGNSTVEDSLFERCKDVGFTSNENVIFRRNMMLYSADNGVSISRGNVAGECTDNLSIGSYHSGILIGGNVATAERGPSNIVVTGNVIDRSGHFGIDATLAPSTCEFRSNSVSRSQKVGMVICGWVFDFQDTYYSSQGSYTRPADFIASNITVSDNAFQDNRRGGIAVYHATGVRIERNTIAFSPATPSLAGVSVKSGVHLYGVSNQGVSDTVRPSSKNVTVKQNVIVDTRTTGTLFDGVTFPETTSWTVTGNTVVGAVRPTRPLTPQ